ncbi:MAG: MFS transporter [Methylotetracoccus sp.]
MTQGHRESAQRINPTVRVLGFVSLLMDTSSEMIHSVLPLFLVTELTASVIAVGLIEGLAESTALIVKVFSGSLSDWIGRRKILAVTGYGLGACSKPLFALAGSAGMVLGARLIDRFGKGIRGAPRDALIADVTPPHLRGAAFGLRQALDTVGALLGPLLATLMLMILPGDFRAIFWLAFVPGALSVVVLLIGVRENPPPRAHRPSFPLRWSALRRFGWAYWWVVGLGAVMTLARFSEAFLVLKAREDGMSEQWLPLVMVTMNAVYALSAYPAGKLSDRIEHTLLLAWGIVLLLLADIVLAGWPEPLGTLGGVTLWGAHLGLTQGLLASMVAATAPPDLRGTAFGVFNLCSGLATLLASLIAGAIWTLYGAPATFIVGAAFCIFSLILLWRHPAAVDRRTR